MSDRPLCYVCCSHPMPEWRWIGGAVEARLRALVTGPTVIRDREAVFLQLQGEPVLVMAIPAPFVDVRTDPDQRTAWAGAETAAAGWRSHFVISALESTGLPSERRMAVANTVLAAAALVGVAHGDAVGWGPTGLFFDALQFVDRVGVDPLHADNLVGCDWTTAETPDGLALGARTRGLAAFGLPELVHVPSSEDRRIIQRRLMSIAAHVIARGPGFRPGEPIGPDAQSMAHVEPGRDGHGPMLMVIPTRERVSQAA